MSINFAIYICVLIKILQFIEADLWFSNYIFKPIIPLHFEHNSVIHARVYVSLCHAISILVFVFGLISRFLRKSSTNFEGFGVLLAQSACMQSDRLHFGITRCEIMLDQFRLVHQLLEIRLLLV